MNPTASDVHVNAPLTNISIAYIQDASAFVAAQVFPNIPVQKQSDRYYTYDRGSFNRDEMQERAPSTESAGSGYDLDSTPTYYAPRYSFHRDIDDEMRANADSVLAPDREATVFVTQKALIKREKLFVKSYMRAGLWTHDMTGVAASPASTSQVLRWNNAASTPIQDVRKAKRGILQSTGFRPNTLVLGRAVYDALVDHPEIIDRVKYGQTPGAPADVDTSALCKLFELPRILVMDAIENIAAEGAPANHVFIGGNNALLCYSTPTPGLMTPTAGYTVSWVGLLGSGQDGNRIRTFRMEAISSDRVEIDMSFCSKLVSADLGLFWNNIVDADA